MVDRKIAPLENSISLAFGDSGKDSKAGVKIVDRRGLALGQVFARSGREKALTKALHLPLAPGRSAVNEEYVALPLAPGQWMLMAETGSDGGFCRGIAEQVGELGFVSEQSHSRVVLRVSGERARELLGKGCRLDLHPRVMQPGACATMVMAQVGVLLHQVDDVPSYDLLVYSGFAQCFWEWLEETAAVFGFEARAEVVDGSGFAAFG